jgi:hypothetical protein
MRGATTFLAGIGLVVASLLGAIGCGEDHHDESFSTYGECYEHLREEGRTASGAFMECDEMFSPTYADMAMCVDYYDDFAQIPMDDITAYCSGMSF